MNKRIFKNYIRQLVMEALELKRSSADNKLIVVSDLEDKPSARNETYKHRIALKSSGFKWNGESWVIDQSLFKSAQKTLNELNKVEALVDKLEDLEEFVQGSDNVSAKSELSGKINAYIEDLSNVVDDVAASKLVKAFLDFNLKFRTYSFTNTMLIYLQNEKATQVAGPVQWKEKFHRKVKPGAHAIKIFAPKFTKYKDNPTQILSPEKKLDQDVERKILSGFKIVMVFDITDTEALDARGEIPAEPQWHGDDTPDEKANTIVSAAMKLMDEMGIKVGNEDSKHGEQGWASGDHINISSTVDGVNKAATLIHEMSHELIHFNRTSLFYDKTQIDKPLSRAIKELQAESISYVVLRYYGFAVNHQSTYLALWKANKEAIQKNFETIKKVSNFIIKQLDEIMGKGKVNVKQDAEADLQ